VAKVFVPDDAVREADVDDVEQEGGGHEAELGRAVLEKSGEDFRPVSGSGLIHLGMLCNKKVDLCPIFGRKINVCIKIYYFSPSSTIARCGQKTRFS
jgi:hypothetical protein